MTEQKYRMTMFDSVRSRLPKIQLAHNGQPAKNKQSSEVSQQNIEINVGLFKKFQAFLLNQKLIKLSTTLKRHCGRHYPIGYRPQFGFNQYWQDQKSTFSESNILQFFQYPQWYYQIFVLLILISKVRMIWTVSIHRLYKMDGENSGIVLIWGLFTLLADVLMQFQLYSHYGYFNQKDGNILKYMKSFWRELLLIAYFSTIPLHYSNYSQQLLILDILVALLLSKRCQQIKTSFRIQITSTSYKDAF